MGKFQITKLTEIRHLITRGRNAKIIPLPYQNWLVQNKNISEKVGEHRTVITYYITKELSMLRKELCEVIKESNLVFGGFVNS